MAAAFVAQTAAMFFGFGMEWQIAATTMLTGMAVYFIPNKVDKDVS